jgi:putative FmdB family regulatory protein
MPTYSYSCVCGKTFDRHLVPHTKRDEPVCCIKCGKQASRLMSTGIVGLDGNPEPWHYDYTKKAKPKYVRDSKGNRQKYDPTKHTSAKGRGI